MLIGTMNHPARDLLQEINWIAQAGFEFIDLTLEPPLAAVWAIDISRVKAALEDHHLPVVGHTAYYLPLCSPFESLRRAAVEELKSCAAAFAKLGVKWMNVHPDRQAPMHDRKFIIERNLRSLAEVNDICRDLGMGLMIENLPGSYNTVRQLSDLMEALPELGLHLDIGHANLMVDVNTTDELLRKYGRRLRHVHLHDNKGGTADLHLPLGTGQVDIPHCVRSLQMVGYDSTITLEVFTPERRYVDLSREILRNLWKEALATHPPMETTQPTNDFNSPL